MAKQCGGAIVVSLENNEATPAYEAIAGLRSRSVSLNSEAVDVTSAGSTGRWREILDACGVQSMSISGSGVFDSGTAASEVLEVQLAGSVRNWKFLVPGLGTFTGPFKITALEFSGEYNDGVMNSFTAESAGEVTFAAV